MFGATYIPLGKRRVEARIYQCDIVTFCAFKQLIFIFVSTSIEWNPLKVFLCFCDSLSKGFSALQTRFKTNCSISQLKIVIACIVFAWIIFNGTRFWAFLAVLDRTRQTNMMSATVGQRNEQISSAPNCFRMYIIHTILDDTIVISTFTMKDELFTQKYTCVWVTVYASAYTWAFHT